MNLLKIYLIGSLALCTIGAAQATTVASFTSGSTSPSDAEVGFSFTTAASGTSWDDLVMTLFEDTNSTIPIAVGTGYLLSSPYTGSVTGLSGVSDIASAVASGGAYTFAPSVTLAANTQYWFYEDGVTSPSLGLGYAPSNAGQTLYVGFNGPTFQDFTADPGDGINFQLTAAPMATGVPEPVTLSLFGAGLAGMAAIRRRKKAKSV